MEYEKIDNSNEPRYLNDDERDFTRRIIVNFYRENNEEIVKFLSETKFPQRRILDLKAFDEFKKIFDENPDIDKNLIPVSCLAILLGLKTEDATNYVRSMEERKEGFDKNKTYKDWKVEYYTQEAIEELEEQKQSASDEMDEYDRNEYSGNNKRFLEAQEKFNEYNAKLQELNSLSNLEPIKSFIEEYTKSFEKDRTRK